MRADIAVVPDRVAEDAAAAVERQARVGHHVAALEVGQERLGTVAGPSDRPADHARRPQDGKLLGIDHGARAEAAADVLRDHADALGRHLERLGQRLPLARDTLAAQR